MAPKLNDADVLNKIQGTYVPFLKKLIAFLEKNKKATPENLTKLKAIYTIFTTANSREQIETFHANQKKLENWYNKAQKEKHVEDGDTTSKGKKRSFTCSDTESSQGACEQPSSTKKARTSFDNAVDPDQPAILKVQSVATLDPATIKKEQHQKQKEKENQQKEQQQQQQEEQQPEPGDDEPVVFTCASCQFQTTEEAEFMKHARTDHRTDLSMWCKRCGKCFSNAGVLVSHIKDRRACAREEMVYRCGVKGCVFETASGQTFVHHLRHCHKGSPFIFCVHCQKIFTLPHCLILHMQDDCPFKDRNRRGGGGGGATTEKAAAPPPAAPTPAPVVSRPVIQQAPAPTVVAAARSPAAVVGRATPLSAPPTRGLSSVGRGRGGWSRGRGRGRGRLRHDSDEDTSDSDDPDDPSWRPEESLGDTGLRRSGRWAKRVNDVLNAEPSPQQHHPQGAAFKMQMVSCPCCDFLAAFQSVLEDHYIANHKAPNRNACVVCKLKFENTPAFLQHFEEHRKGVLPNEPPVPTATAPTPTQQQQQQQNKEPPPPPKQQQQKQQEEAPPKATSSDSNGGSNNKAVLPLTAGEPGVVNASTCRQGAVKIPYQSAIHEKNNLRAGLGKFEELKSPSDLSTMKTEAKLRHLFKCALYSCAFTTDSTSAFEQHLRAQHSGRRLQCGYCFREEASPVQLAAHVASAHGARTFQCSGCFYRACSKSHLRVHARHVHPEGDPVRVLSCKEVSGNREEEEQQHTMWPFICAIDACSYSTYDPAAFKRHNETVHRTTSVYFCFYCKVDFLTFKRLMNHYRLHGLNLYQCQHCVHGAETEDEILAHLCNAHPDKEFKAYKRGGVGAAQNEDKQNEVAPVTTTTNNNNDKRTKTDEDELLYQAIDNDCYPAHMRSRHRCYPRYLRHVATEVVCGRCAEPRVFPSLEPYLAHLREDHDAANYPCPHCWETCATVEDFRNHLLCHASKLYVCGAEGCSFYDWRKDTVTWHAKQKHEKKDGEGPASVALREFKALEDEENRVHALPAPPPSEEDERQQHYLCPFCGLKGRDRNLMKNHMYHELSYLRFECSLCGQRCASRRDVRQHYASAHPDLDIASPADTHPELESAVRAALERPLPNLGENTTTCDACCTKFETAAMLQFHMRVCLRREYRPYECAPCGRRFATLLLLRNHTDETHADPWGEVKFAHAPNDDVERDLGRNVQKVRLRQLKDALGGGEGLAAPPPEDCKVKFYTCSECPYEAHHKYNVERHARLEHGGGAKVMKGVESGAKQQRPFGCGHCSKRAWTRREVERHVRAAHDAEGGGFFYYSPRAQQLQEAEESEVYECAYCKSTRESLSSLRKHADLMHADMEFKVKGSVSSCPSGVGDALACGHCYLSVDGAEELRNHTSTAHPLLQPRFLGTAAAVVKGNAAAPEDTSNFPNKRVRFASDDVHVCGHCGGAFSGLDQVTAHSKRAHSRLAPRFEVLQQSGGDARFYKCEFCRFTGERRFLERHLSAKHRMRVTCRHCGKRFEFASRCKEHHDVAHPGKTLSYSHETLSPAEGGGQQAQPPEEEDDEEDEDEPMEEEDVVDLSSITVHMEVKDGESAELPLVYVTERFNLFPKVVLRDVMKGGGH